MESASRGLFARLMRQPAERIDLAQAALLIAQQEYQDLDCARYLAQIDDMGQQARARTAGLDDPEAIVQALNGYLFDERGFHGNRDDYYDPRNSFLNDVLDRRTGIPITLSTVYMEVARRAGFRVDGVGFPAHFLVKYVHRDGREILLDPFDRGAALTEEDCRQKLLELSGGTVAYHPRFLRQIPTKQIVARMLLNLKQIYVASRYYRKAVAVIDYVLLVTPDAWTEVRDRGLMHYELKDCEAARKDLTAYLEHAVAREEADAIRERLQEIENIVMSMDA